MTDIVERLRINSGLIMDNYGAMGSPICLEAADEIERLRAALKECADDLEAWINHHYEKTKDYPSEKRRFERDMEPVLIARKLLDPK